jgi:hypothetical protein
MMIILSVLMGYRSRANQRVDTYSVYGGADETSLARPKSASFRTSLLTNRFSAIAI